MKQKRIQLILLLAGLLLIFAGMGQLWTNKSSDSHGIALVPLIKTGVEKNRIFISSLSLPMISDENLISPGKPNTNANKNTNPFNSNHPNNNPIPQPVPPVKPNQPASPPTVKEKTITLFIKGDQQVGTIYATKPITIKNGDTVLSVLLRATKASGIQMEYRGSGSTAYIEGIANLYEFDRGSESGWMYRVNGVFPKKSAGAYYVKPSDRVEWLYTTNLGKDLGAELR